MREVREVLSNLRELVRSDIASIQRELLERDHATRDWTTALVQDRYVTRELCSRDLAAVTERFRDIEEALARLEKRLDTVAGEAAAARTWTKVAAGVLSCALTAVSVLSALDWL
jgi:hypothetical protein